MEASDKQEPKRRLSILKTHRTIEDEPTTSTRQPARVSFSSNFIKVFREDPHKNTSWNTTIEETISDCHTTVSTDTSSDGYGLNKSMTEDEMELTECGGRIYREPSNYFLDDDSMELTECIGGILSTSSENKENIPFVGPCMVMFETENCGEDMEITCENASLDGIISMKPRTATMNVESRCEVSMELTETSLAGKIYSVYQTGDVSMEFTCVNPPVAEVATKNVKQSLNMSLASTANYPHETGDVSMEFTCVNPPVAEVATKNVKQSLNMSLASTANHPHETGDVSMEFTCVNPPVAKVATKDVKQGLNMSLASEANHPHGTGDISMEFTCVNPPLAELQYRGLPQSSNMSVAVDVEKTITQNEVNEKHLDEGNSQTIESAKEEFNIDSNRECLKENVIVSVTCKQRKKNVAKLINYGVLENTNVLADLDVKLPHEAAAITLDETENVKNPNVILTVPTKSQLVTETKCQQELQLETIAIIENASSFNLTSKIPALVETENRQKTALEKTETSTEFWVDDTEVLLAANLDLTNITEEIPNLTKNISSPSTETFLKIVSQVDDCDLIADESIPLGELDKSVQEQDTPSPSKAIERISESEEPPQVNPVFKEKPKTIKPHLIPIDFDAHRKKLNELNERSKRCQKIREEFAIFQEKYFEQFVRNLNTEEESVSIQDTKPQSPPPPPTMKEQIEEKSKIKGCCWSVDKISTSLAIFTTFEKKAQIKVEFCKDNLTVSKMKIKTLLSEQDPALLHFVYKEFKKLMLESRVTAAVGRSYNVLSFLDYLQICMEKIKKFEKELEYLTIWHKFAIDRSNRATFLILEPHLLIRWVFELQLSNVDNISKDKVSIEGEEDVEIHRQSIINLVDSCPKGLDFLKSFLDRVNDYIKQIEEAKK